MEAIASLYKSGLGSNKWVQIWIITMTELLGKDEKANTKGL